MKLGQCPLPYNLRNKILSESQKVNLAVSCIEAKITAGLATQTQSDVCTTPHNTSLVRAEDVGQGNNNITASPHRHIDNTSCAASMSVLNTCNVSACNGSVNNVPDMSCNNNVNALSVVVPNDYADLNELSLSKFKNSAKQAVIHFLRELDEYFTLKKMPYELKLPPALEPMKTLLPNSGSQLYVTLLEHTRISRPRLQTYCGDKHTKLKYGATFTNTAGISVIIRPIQSTIFAMQVWHPC
jgi:hypothetical protein